MKKYLLVTLTILFAATFVWAADATTAESAIDIEADATLSWGVDFGSSSDSTPRHGFNNEASWTVKFPIYKKADRTSTKSNVPVYGEVSLTEVKLNIVSEDGDKKKFIVDGKVKGLKAKLVFYGAYLTVHDKPDFSANYAQIWEPLEKDDDYDEKPFTFKGKFDGYGTKLGYANKDLMDLDVGLKFGSNGNWETEPDKPEIDYTVAPSDVHNLAPVPPAPPAKVPADKIWVSKVDGKKYYEDEKPAPGEYWEYGVKPVDPAKHGIYGIGFDFSMKPLDKMLAVALTVNSVLHTSYDKNPNVNFGVKVTSEPIDGLAFKAAFDGMYVFDKSFDWDTLFTAQYKWVGAGVYVGSEGTFIGKGTPDNMVDMAVFAQFETKGEKEDATNLVEGLDAGVYVGMYRLIRGANDNKFPLFTKVWGAYKININDSMWIKPFADLWLETVGKDVKLAYDLGVTFSPVEKVEVQAKWNQGTTDKNKYETVIDKSALNGDHYGTFVLSLTVKY
jgi:major outer sheath protein